MKFWPLAHPDSDPHVPLHHSVIPIRTAFGVDSCLRMWCWIDCRVCRYAATAVSLLFRGSSQLSGEKHRLETFAFR